MTGSQPLLYRRKSYINENFSKAQATATTAPTSPSAMGFEMETGFALMQRAAALLAASALVPREYQNNIANCTIALEMASRIGASPLMVMQEPVSC
jgi:hypothetical protein